MLARSGGELALAMVFSRFLNCAGFGGTVSATFTVAITTVITTAIATTTTPSCHATHTARTPGWQPRSSDAVAAAAVLSS